MKKICTSAAVLFALATTLTGCIGEVGGDSGETGSPFALGNANLRIAVVGAGPSGLMAAHELEARGYTNVTVFEKEDHVGGKVNTINLLGQNVELGAVFANVEDYHLVLSLAQQYGIATVASTLPRFVYDHGAKRTYQEFLLAHYTPEAIQGAVGAYMAMRAQFPQIDADGMAGLPDDLKLNFDEFAVKYHFEPLAEMVRSLIVGFGYGYYDNVPAIYALKIMNMLIKVDATGVHDSHYVGFPTGYQSLWKAVADDLNRPVQLSAKVTSVKRSRGNGPLKVIVNGDSANEQEFDAVIVSAPLSAVPSFVTLSDEEKALFAKVESSRYFITLFALPGAETGQAVFVHDNAFSDRINHAAVWANPGGGVPIFQAYQIAERTTKVLGIDVPLPAAAVTATLAADMLSLANGVFAGPLVRKEWPDYFPRVNKDALQAGFYDQVEALQGVKGLYYVGGTLSFETVETSARYAQSLIVDRFPTTNLVVSGN